MGRQHTHACARTCTHTDVGKDASHTQVHTYRLNTGWSVHLPSPARSCGLWGLVISGLAMPRASPGVCADLTRPRARVLSLPLPTAAEALGLRGVPPQTQGTRASHCMVEGVLCGPELAFCHPGWAGLGCPCSRHQSQGWAGTGRPLGGESCYLQEFCLMGVTVGKTWAERAAGATEGPHPTHSGGDRHTLWAQAGH